MFIDPALAEAARHALSWSPPAIVQRTLLLDRSAAGRQEIAGALDELDRRVAQWLAEGRRVRGALLQAVARDGMAPAWRRALELFIGLVEEKAADTSREAHASLDGMKRRLRQAADLGPDERAFADLVSERLEGAVLRELEERTDFALFLRALVAQNDPEARSGPVFEDPDELRRHLQAVIANS